MTFVDGLLIGLFIVSPIIIGLCVCLYFLSIHLGHWYIEEHVFIHKDVPDFTITLHIKCRLWDKEKKLPKIHEKIAELVKLGWISFKGGYGDSCRR